MTSADAFSRFNVGHLAVLAATLMLALLAVRTARRELAARRFRIALASLLSLTMLAIVAREAARGTLTPIDLLPLHLCDFAVLLAIFALVTLRHGAAELLYFLAFPAILAMITPDVSRDLLHPYTIAFFVLHGGTVIAAAFLTFGKRLAPRRRAALRAFLFLNAYALFAAILNVVLDTNFLYLRAKPAEPSPLDSMGEWPWYIVTAEVIAAVVFSAAALPFRRHTTPDADGVAPP